MSLSLVHLAGSRKIRQTFDISFTFGKNVVKPHFEDKADELRQTS